MIQRGKRQEKAVRSEFNSSAGNKFPHRRIPDEDNSSHNPHLDGAQPSFRGHRETAASHDLGGCMSCNPTLELPQTAFGDGGHPVSSRTRPVLLILEAAFLCFALVLLLLKGFQGLHDFVGDLAISFVAIMVEATPFMLLGSLVGGLIETFIPQEMVGRLLAGRRHGAVFTGAALGLIFPVCECAIVPVVRRLLNKGVPLSAAIAFLLGGPIVNAIVAASTWMAYRGDWGFVATRLIFGYAIAVAVALAMDFLFREKKVLLDLASHEHASSCGCCGHDHAREAAPHTLSKFLDALQHACTDFFEVGRFLVIGAFVAALARTTIGVDVCRELFAAPWAAILMMMGLAIALNLCSETDAFIAAGFRGVLPDTAQMAFMVLGPMLDVKLILMYLTIFRKRVIVTLALLTLLTVLIAMMLLQYGLGGVPGGR